MIKYELVCEHDHSFDSWFRDSASYDRMIEAKAVTCPICGSAHVTKALMAPYLSRGRALSPKIQEPSPESRQDLALPTSAALAEGLPAEAVEKLETVLRELRTQVEKNCDYVGKEFAEEARRIHYGEADARGIYGETSSDEAEALREEGVEFFSLPWTRRDA